MIHAGSVGSLVPGEPWNKLEAWTSRMWRPYHGPYFPRGYIQGSREAHPERKGPSFHCFRCGVSLFDQLRW
jgi:hypothetical protein